MPLNETDPQAPPGAEAAPSARIAPSAKSEQGVVASVGAVASRLDPRRWVARVRREDALLWIAFVAAGIAMAQVPIAIEAMVHASREAAATASARAAASGFIAAATSSAMAVGPASGVSASAAGASAPPSATFRVAQLRVDPRFVVASAIVGKRGCERALEALGVGRGDLLRVEKVVAPFHHLGHCRADDRIVVALGKESRALAALELETAPGEIVSVRDRAKLPTNAFSTAAPAGAADSLVADALTLPVTHKRVATALVVAGDLTSAILATDLDASIVDLLSEAIASRQDIPPIGRGAVVKIVADASLVDGVFDRYDDLVAVEYRARPNADPIRLYHLREEHAGWYDGKGQRPMRGRWRAPIAGARVTSRFNPHRLHPILHTVMPHNGCDFGSPVGTPIYSIGAGVVGFRGDSGPSGNLVTVIHGGGLESGYAHMSRFAASIVPGAHVEEHTLLGYVGTTGRSTGPHLHLSLKKDGVFIDPQSLHLDASYSVPHAHRDAFAQRKSDADLALDAIVIPQATPAPAIDDVPSTPSNARGASSAEPAPISPSPSLAMPATSASAADEAFDDDLK